MRDAYVAETEKTLYCCGGRSRVTSDVYVGGPGTDSGSRPECAGCKAEDRKANYSRVSGNCLE
jgi:hypothetical protein